MLDVRDLTVRFGDRVVLDHVDLAVARGEIVALLGPSGSGKSTLLRVIAGIIVPDAGCVVLDGVDITRLPTHRRSVGLVFQDEQLFPHLTVAANIGFGMKMAGVAKPVRATRTRELLAIVGLGGLGDRSIDRLSGGERKRVALARSLAPQPKLLLLDEPLTGLDEVLHDRLEVEIRDVLRETGTTVVWVTHDADEAAAVADRTVMLAELTRADGTSGTVPP